jgi:hypothetical protein
MNVVKPERAETRIAAARVCARAGRPATVSQVMITLLIFSVLMATTEQLRLRYSSAHFHNLRDKHIPARLCRKAGRVVC